MQLTKKQAEVLNSYLEENPKILVASGAKRAGKTFILTWIFLMHIAKFRNQGLSFLIGGASQASIRRNVLNDMEDILGKELKIDKSNAVEIFGNKVYCFDGANADTWKKIRGWTSAGAFLNEGTALHDDFVKEAISRCSYPGARIFIDTNPENPAHPVKTDYIDNDGQRLSSGQLNIRAFNFTLFDNDKLDPEYVESIVAATPSGMFTDRDIYGRWVAAEGVVYPDFKMDEHSISREVAAQLNYKKYFAGVDWGYGHFGSIVVIGQTTDDKFILLEEIAKRHEEIDYWVRKAKEVQDKYGNIMFYADSARPEYVVRFQQEGIKAVNADKSRLSGIEQVASLIKKDKFLIVNDVKRFKEEINMYVWSNKGDKPVEEYDDVLDAIRYAIYTELGNKYALRTMSKRKLGL